MTDAGIGIAVTARPLPRRAPAPSRLGRGSWWIRAVPSAVMLTVLVVRNRFLFGTRLYEQGDSGADSILIEQARHFTLLVGNYSREEFFHPGPALLYIQSWGESLFWGLLHVVPTPWNGQLLAVYALNSALSAIAVGIVYKWTRSAAAASAAFAVLLGFAAAYPASLSSGWPPNMYVMPFLVFTLCTASVAARRADDLWALSLSGWLLIHGHACFLFFVPLMSLVAAAAAMWPSRRSLGTFLRAFGRDQRRAWVPALAISALFTLPMVLELILHWPGNFGKYVSYGDSGNAGGHTLGQVLGYTLWFWWPGGHAWAASLVLLALLATSAAVSFGPARGPLRRFTVAAIGMTLVASLAFGYYAFAGIDALTPDGYYMGYFYRSVPFLLLLVIAVGITEAIPRRLALALAAAGSVAALVATGFAPGLRSSMHDNNEALPGAVTALASRGPGKAIVISLAQHDLWISATGFLVQAERTGVRACLAQHQWKFIVTSQFICTPHDLKDGVRYTFALSPGRRAA